MTDGTEGVPAVTRDPARLAHLRGYRILDSAPDDRFDALTRLAAHVFEMPIALVSLVDEDRQWFKSHHGMKADETPIEQAICAHVLHAGAPVVIPDTLEDARTVGNTLCHGPEAVRFYAGAPLLDGSGHIIGTFCLLDTRPRDLAPDRVPMLEDFAGQSMELIRLHKLLAEKDLARQETDHRIKNSLSALMSTLRLQRRGLGAEDGAADEVLRVTETRIGMLAALHEALCYTDHGLAIDLAEFLQSTVRAATIGAPREIRSSVRAAPRTVDANKAAALGSVVNEFVQNSLKHAFPDGRDGLIEITGEALPDGAYRLILSDDGIGLPEVPPRRGLGLRIIESTASQFSSFAAGPGEGGRGHRLVLEMSAPEDVTSEENPV